MLKVLINEEEVLTNKDFTIKKEMLNTPSVILNNVYPKTWEDTKDYTSNFYHPQDYSKCKIIDENIVPAEPGETITGTSFTIQDNDSTKLVELTELDGNTTQDGTPTPDSPQPIEVVTGQQEILVEGKNLFDKDNLNSIDAYMNTSTLKLAPSNTVKTYYITCKPNTTYTIQKVLGKQFRVGTSENIPVVNGDLLQAWQNNDITTHTITTDSNAKYLCINIRNSSTDTLTEQEILNSIQIEKGSTASEYEAYKGQSYEINLGKNLFDISTADYTNKCTLSNEVYTTDTLTTNARNVIFGSRANNWTIYPNETYYFSVDMRIVSGTSKNMNAFRFSINGGTTTMITNPDYTNEFQRYLCSWTNSTGNIVNTGKILFQPSNTNLSNGVFEFKNVMVSKSSDIDYAPYKTPIELCKIGTYQDKIYKENGTWYLHKEIGKIVLDGASSETWGILNVSTNCFKLSNFENGNGTDTQINYPILSTHFLSTKQGLVYGGTIGIQALGGTTKALYICFGSSSSITDVSALRTWLATHNTIVYYVLATPTTTEITDSELISQLNSIELLEGLNNVSVSSADLPGEITIHYNYTEEQTIDDLLFCGVVKNSGNISLNPREPHYLNIQILDFKTFLSEGELDSFVIYQKTILEAIQMVIANIQDYGFILGNINILNPTDIIGAYSTKDKTAYDVFNYIADITQSRWTTRLIDENHVAIDFYDPTLMIEGTPINYTQTFFEDNLIDDMTYSYGSNNYRNKQVMTSSQVYSNISQQQSIVANGYQTQFPTEQPIGKINSITSNGIPLTFATFTEKEMGYVADFYYSPGDNYFESEDLRSTGEILIIDYIAIVEGRQIITNPLEIDRISDSTGRKGIISRYEQRNDATTSTELQKIGESYIKYKGTPEIKLKIKTRSNIWEVGQRVQFNAPITELNTEYMIRTKKINYISTIDTIFYEYELISSFNSETEINYFDNQRAKASGNIGEGEYISRNIDIESTANIIFYDTETTEVQVVGDNVLNSVLNSPFTS